ncbi:MAG: hypothetical protein H7X83_06010 [Verrucomicrobia bacterium]|nr:hypothetical protein [Deltaproteobacteria bacterium]
MAELFLDIRDRHIRAIASEGEIVRFQKAYPLKAAEAKVHNVQDRQSTAHAGLLEGELADILSRIRSDAGVSLDHAHLILPSAEVRFTTHVLPRMPQQEALKLLTRKTVAEPGGESPQINLAPMAIEQNNQTWLAEYVTTDTLKAYKKEFSASRLKLKTVTTALDATLHAVASIRESIFNAHAIFEVNTHSIEAYYISASCLLFHETLETNESSDFIDGLDAERNQKRRMYTILDLLYRINSQYLSSNPMNPLQKAWLCGTDASIPELVTALQDALGVETALLTSGQTDDQVTECRFTVLKGLQKAYHDGLLVNFMHPDLLRRFPLRKKSGMLVYIATALLAAFVVTTTEYRHSRLNKRAGDEKKALASQKSSQATSATYAKNLDLLRKLSGSQVMFYPIFRELAMNLPDGVYLDSFSYSSKDSRDTIDISATFKQSGDLGTQKTLTRLMEVMDRSPYLNNHREPSVISTTKELKKAMTVKFTCEVHPLDTAK